MSLTHFQTPPMPGSEISKNLATILIDWAKKEPDHILLSYKDGDQWVHVGALELHNLVSQVAKGLIQQGVGIGDRVALMCRTRYEWSILDFAIFYAGAVTVPIYETSSTEQVQWILEDSGAKHIIVETPQLYGVVAPAVKDSFHSYIINENLISQLQSLGASISDDTLMERVNSRGGDDLATLIYTSGTTGKPKGVEITHGIFWYESIIVVNSVPELFLEPNNSTLLFLPLAHVFGRMIEIGALYAGLHVGHTSDVADLSKDLATFKPSFILAVPRIFEKVFNAAELKAKEAGKEKIFNLAVDTAISYSQFSDRGSVPFFIKIKHAIFTRLVYKKILNGLGGNVRAAISGGAPLSVRLGHFFKGIGIITLEGYGLTETSAAVTLNLVNDHKLGSVGKPLPGISIRIEEDGEILLKGGVVMKGYWKNDAANSEVFTQDGYFKTGDLGHFDAQGFLSIVGRKKEIIVTSGGKNVSPSTLEDSLRSHPLISQVVILGDNQTFIAALITLDADTVKVWVKENRKEDLTLDMLIKDKQLLQEIQKYIDETNRKVSRAESIRKFQILPKDFSIESGELTAKLSVKRRVVFEKYSDVIASLYAPGSDSPSTSS